MLCGLRGTRFTARPTIVDGPVRGGENNGLAAAPNGRSGDDWKFPACYRQHRAACAGVPSPVGVLDKHAAAGGVAIVTHELSGRFASSALVAEWQLGRVKRVALRRTKDGYTGTVTTFLTGIANPLPIVTTNSGAVLVGDWNTGTIYAVSAGRA